MRGVYGPFLTPILVMQSRRQLLHCQPCRIHRPQRSRLPCIILNIIRLPQRRRYYSPLRNISLLTLVRLNNHFFLFCNSSFLSQLRFLHLLLGDLTLLLVCAAKCIEPPVMARVVL